MLRSLAIYLLIILITFSCSGKQEDVASLSGTWTLGSIYCYSSGDPVSNGVVNTGYVESFTLIGSSDSFQVQFSGRSVTAVIAGSQSGSCGTYTGDFTVVERSSDNEGYLDFEFDSTTVTCTMGVDGFTRTGGADTDVIAGTGNYIATPEANYSATKYFYTDETKLVLSMPNGFAGCVTINADVGSTGAQSCTTNNCSTSGTCNCYGVFSNNSSKN
jgi:hypothetical protein